LIYSYLISIPENFGNVLLSGKIPVKSLSLSLSHVSKKMDTSNYKMATRIRMSTLEKYPINIAKTKTKDIIGINDEYNDFACLCLNVK